MPSSKKKSTKASLAKAKNLKEQNTKKKTSEKKFSQSKSTKKKKMTSKTIDKQKKPTLDKSDVKPNNAFQDLKKKNELLSRHLLRLYQFINDENPINEPKLLEEMDLGTPNEELRLRINQLELEIESIYEENHALRQNALQSQIESEDQVESIEFENQELKEKVKEINQFVKAELNKRSKRYEVIITDLRARLRTAIEKNEKVTEVNERISFMGDQVKSLFDQNDKLNKLNDNLDKQIIDLKEKYEESQELTDKLKNKVKEFQKKTDLQKMVIDGYKRKER